MTETLPIDGATHADCACSGMGHRHGEVNTYKRHACRCALCTKANRDHSRAHARARRKLTSTHRPRRWTAGELSVLAETMAMAAVSVAELLGRSTGSVEMARFQRLRDVPSRKQWTQEDIAVVRETPEWTAEQVGRKIGRTTMAVNSARANLTASEGVTFGTTNKSPLRVGRRQLVARTCHACGLLLDASWFYACGSSWSARCSRCLRDANADRDSRQSKTDEQVAEWRENDRRREAHAQENATNSWQEWTEADYVILMDESLAVMEKALRLRRTYGATKARASAMGARHRRDDRRGEPIEFWSVTQNDG